MTPDYMTRYTEDENGCWNYAGTINPAAGTDRSDRRRRTAAQIANHQGPLDNTLILPATSWPVGA